MLFNSYDFMVFFPIVVILLFIIPKKIKYVWLFIASYYFYMSWNPKYAILIAFSTLITYICGLFMGKINDKNKRKIVLVLGIVINLGILFVFKYSDFVLTNINEMCKMINVSCIDRKFDIVLPVGISFYTFQALGYAIDVYRGDIKPEKNLIRYALFVSFFPQLVAGPIERSKNLLNQIDKLEEIVIVNFDRIISGLFLMLWGLFQKMVIADRVAIIVNTIFDKYMAYNSIELLCGAVGFAIQIYCDFSSYSTIAIGAANVMGFDLMDNFDTPYFATSIKEFWRRWHISLSQWFRDYVYIPLGGSRCSKVKKYRNLMITFLLSGLWHGANWTFVVWGGLHGIYQVVGDLTQKTKNKIYTRWNFKTESVSFKVTKMIVTFTLVNFAWIFFRANTVRDAIIYIWRMLTRINLWALFDGSLNTSLGVSEIEINILMIAIGILLIVDLIQYIAKKRIDIVLKNETLAAKWMFAIVLIFFVLIFGVYGPQFSESQFIYFQF